MTRGSHTGCGVRTPRGHTMEIRRVLGTGIVILWARAHHAGTSELEDNVWCASTQCAVRQVLGGSRRSL